MVDKEKNNWNISLIRVCYRRDKESFTLQVWVHRLRTQTNERLLTQGEDTAHQGLAVEFLHTTAGCNSDSAALSLGGGSSLVCSLNLSTVATWQHWSFTLDKSSLVHSDSKKS